MATDGDIDYSGYSDADLAAVTSAIDFERYPNNARALTREVSDRWRRAQVAASAVVVSTNGGDAYRFKDLPPADVAPYLWRYLGFTLCFGMAYSVFYTVVAMLSYVAWEFIAITVRGLRPKDSNVEFQVVFALVGLVLFIPTSKFWLNFLTSRTFGGYGLRLVRPSAHDVA